jgi:hypothetical protein
VASPRLAMPAILIPMASAFNFSTISFHQLISMNFLKDDCYQTVDKYCFSIEFHFEGRRRGFNASQLTHVLPHERQLIKPDPAILNNAAWSFFC